MQKLNIKPNNVLKGPRITEKAAISADKHNVYVFEVEKFATKASIIASIRDAYKVVPTDVRVVNIPARKVIVRGKRGVKSAVKKAYVALKKGDKIELL
ncbi:MAG: 50S ribosomal protein L23 [Parcubacteria group bacterium GW2011_GWB1_49_7]|uniref:Large ribosomal subunit protein uL23 n=1 Tax=Candidatus Zambryskibacteria bacterium RIFCSPHIGHO2_01_FULL_46_25 TaxID=1802738 RepID=A0A1G2SYR0_9BACT|nr:MAG: 50S ribosomal protein L23 [Parcubacteria group bacterium GW2011_GWA1_47_10]KKW09690.1 MAG: 50S ribosomal protein L23 [Parcubacteria group bacterium GW2011_GWB1_49_7]OHA90133.1 MAG: 50S ribosomal protein L23 [Candidatus Zambryskibacteria bacterium RIFCSPHIGHO2_01_FULL_46_25]OHB01312.1 MAG: 50S ribosomal protein L23 [Candidatus Zambryskibacteria bacterium RIFCSPHIGHO2_12_FULL_48_10]OHB06492.1 MAG: 50S ribosomal protein L23 [Candidatus Zambryskibacteria bacterium RIFCSPLOWO2_01_FULL_48_25]